MGGDEAKSIRPGDRLIPNPRWNASEIHRKLATPTVVIDVRHGCGCPTGGLVCVKDLRGAAHWLDAGWFRSRLPMRRAPALWCRRSPTDPTACGIDRVS